MQYHANWNMKAAVKADPILSIKDLGKTYGQGKNAFVAVDNLSLDVRSGEFVCILGPSGCGKSTLLKMISGLMAPTTGSVEMFGVEVKGVPDNLGVVLQDYSRSLFPWMRVHSNVAFGLHSLKLDARERRERVATSLKSVGLAGHEQKYPWELSGGMQQRVAIARAIAYRPQVLLMDEPFASVDAQMRAELEDLTLEIHRTYGMTTVFITHDIDEAIYLSNRVLVLGTRPGRLVAEIPVELPEERDQIATREIPEFVKLRAEAARLVREASFGRV
ncbi:ABC transporter ATP-binding protein [Roseibium sp. M-1]